MASTVTIGAVDRRDHQAYPPADAMTTRASSGDDDLLVSRQLDASSQSLRQRERPAPAAYAPNSQRAMGSVRV